MLEIRRDGTVYLDDELMAEAPGDERDLKKLRKALFELSKNAPKDPDFELEDFVSDLRLLVAVDKEAPYSLVQEVLAVLRYRGILISHVYLCVQGLESSEPMAIRIYIAQDIGTSCGPGPKSISRVEWYGEAAEARGAKRAVLRIERVDEFLPGMDDEPPPVINDGPPRYDDDLAVWMREGDPKWGLSRVEPLNGTTWQDVVRVIDLALEEKMQRIEDCWLKTTLEVLARNDR